MERFTASARRGAFPWAAAAVRRPGAGRGRSAFAGALRDGPQNREKICKLLIKISPIRRWSIV